MNRDQWLAALVEAEGPTDQDAIAVGEFAAMVNLPRKTAADRLARMVASGRAIQTYKHILSSAGQRRRVPAYRLVQAVPKKKR